MAKNMSDILKELKGNDNDKALTGKGAFSGPGFAGFVNAMANDRNYKVDVFNKSTGKEEKVSISELFVNDAKKTIANANYPQKSEIGVVDETTIATNGVAQAIPHIVNAWLRTGRKFPLPDQKDQTGFIYLANVPGKTKEVAVRDMKTGEANGSTVITTKDHIQIRAKSSAPKHLTSKVRKDKNGKTI